MNRGPAQGTKIEGLLWARRSTTRTATWLSEEEGLSLDLRELQKRPLWKSARLHRVCMARRPRARAAPGMGWQAYLAA
eukprot:14530488-Heterocapsa_arctica.AAC.1